MPCGNKNRNGIGISNKISLYLRPESGFQPEPVKDAELFNKISMNLLTDIFQAYYDARKNKRNTVNQLRFEVNCERNLLQLYDDIRNRTYQISPSICFIVQKPVKREVFAADFRDRVVHHLLFNYINPLFEDLFIEDSYSCRKNRGTLYGVKRVAGFIRECSDNYTRDCHILKLDIRGYFMNIDKVRLHAVIRDFLTEKLRDSASYKGVSLNLDLLLYLVNVILNDDPTQHCRLRSPRREWDGLPKSKSLFHSPENCGLPIGNLTSQLFSNVYLHAFDSYMTQKLNLAYYGRYVDDFVVVHRDPLYLKSLVQTIRQFLLGKPHAFFRYGYLTDGLYWYRLKSKYLSKFIPAEPEKPHE